MGQATLSEVSSETEAFLLGSLNIFKTLFQSLTLIYMYQLVRNTEILLMLNPCQSVKSREDLLSTPSHSEHSLSIKMQMARMWRQDRSVGNSNSPSEAHPYNLKLHSVRSPMLSLQLIHTLIFHKLLFF